MSNTRSTKKTWAKPQIARLGRIGDVSAIGPGTAQAANPGNCPTPGNPCVLS